MFWTIYSVAVSGGSKIGVMARPSGGHRLQDEIRSIRDQGFSVLVSLLTTQSKKNWNSKQKDSLCEQLD